MFESIYRLGICWRSTGRAVLLGKILILSCGLSLEPLRIGYPPAFRCFSHSSHCSMARPPYSSRQPNPHRYLMYVLWRHLADLSQTSRRFQETGLWDSTSLMLCGHCVPVSCMFDHIWPPRSILYYRNSDDSLSGGWPGFCNRYFRDVHWDPAWSSCG